MTEIAKTSKGCLASNDIVAVGVVRIFSGLKKVGAVLPSTLPVSLEHRPGRGSPATTAPHAGCSHGVGKDSHPTNLATCMLAAVQVAGRG